MSAFNYIVSRLKEPSTYAGFSGLALAAGLSNDLYTAAAAVVAAVAGLLAMLIADGGTAE